MIKSTSFFNCAICGNQVTTKNSIFCEGQYFCLECYSALNTCHTCVYGNRCEFNTNPSPIPREKMVIHRDGNMVVQTMSPNPDRIKTFCMECKCYCDEKNNIACNKFTALTCSNYKNICLDDIK